MGVSIEVWRAKIGRFTHPKGLKQIKKILPYDPSTEWTPCMDTGYRLLLCISVFLLVGGLGSITASWIPDALPPVIPPCTLCTTSQGESEICEDYFAPGTLFTYRKQDMTLLATVPCRINLPSMIHRSGDIELNPGPTNSDLDDMKKEIIKQIKNSEERLSTEIRSIKEDIKSMKVEIGVLRKDVKANKEEQEVMKLDIQTVNEDNGRLEGHLCDLEARVEEQERRSRHNNMVLYGISETSPKETYTESKQKVLELLNSAREVKGLEPIAARDIERAHRISTKSKDKTRPIIVRMKHWEDKWQAVKMREILKDKGIGIANDMTTFQRRELYRLRNLHTDTRFYYKGNKLIEEPRQDTESQPEEEEEGASRAGTSRDASEAEEPRRSRSSRPLRSNSRRGRD